MSEAKSLAVYHDDHTWRVAESAEDACAQEFKETGCGERDGNTPDAWARLSDDRPVTFREEAESGTPKITKTAAEWVALKGRGYLCSLDW